MKSEEKLIKKIKTKNQESEEKKQNYQGKNDSHSSREEKIDLLCQYGWTSKDIQKYFGISYQNALSVFKSCKLKFGSIMLDKRQVKVEDILAYVCKTTSQTELKRLNAGAL